MYMTENNAPLFSGKKNTTMAVVAYILFFVPLLTGDAKKDAFVKYHTKQGLVLFLCAIALSAVSRILPFSFWWTISQFLNLGVFVLMVIGIVHATNGEQKPLPIIGQFADVFKF